MIVNSATQCPSRVKCRRKGVKTTMLETTNKALAPRETSTMKSTTFWAALNVKEVAREATKESKKKTWMR